MGCGESKHAVSTQNTISLSKRSNSKKNTEEEKVINGDENAPLVKEEEEEKIPQAENVDDQNVNKDKDNKEASPPVSVPAPTAVGNLKEDEKVEKEKSMVEDVKEAQEKEKQASSSSSSSSADKAVVVDEGKGGEEKKELKEENPIEEAKMEDASEEKKDSGEIVKENEPTKEIETHQDAKNGL